MTYEIIGTFASLLVLASFVMEGEQKIRFVNNFGCLVFVIYGLLIGAFSVWFLNGAVLILNLAKLHKMKKEKSNGKVEPKRTGTRDYQDSGGEWSTK